jgi:hypothetical protein
MPTVTKFEALEIWQLVQKQSFDMFEIIVVRHKKGKA